jgi:hypothetical protein
VTGRMWRSHYVNKLNNLKKHANIQEYDEEILHRQFMDLQDEFSVLEMATSPSEALRYIFNHLIHCNKIYSFVFILSTFLGLIYALIDYFYNTI